MEELSEERSSEGLDIQRYLDVARRRHIHFLIPLLLGWLVVWGASWVIPARYKSSTLILVEQPTMPKNYVEPNVSDDLQDRLQSITQQILSRTRLLLIIDKLHLYGDKQGSVAPDAEVERMRKDIDIEVVRSSDAAPITAFRIYYTARDPHLAQQVTSELTDLFINENLKVRQQESQDTTTFIESHLEDARAALADQEAKVREFEAAHQGDLPSQEASNLQILSGLQSQLQNEQDSLNAATQQRAYTQSVIDYYRNLHTPNLHTTSPDGSPTGLVAIDQELDRLRVKLTDLSSGHTDQYPEIKKLKDQIAETEKTRADLLAKSEAVDKGTSSPLPADPSQGLPTLQLQGQLKAYQAEIENRERAVSALKVRINEYQARLNSEPASEQQLADLTRGYDQSKANYDELLKKKNESAMATSMEQMQQGERFSMLDPPSLPSAPDFPNRLKFCGIGIGVGLALGLLVVGGLEVMDDRLHSEKEIKLMLPVAVISEIPEILNPSDEGSNKRKIALGWAMTAVVTATILAGSAFSYLRD